MRKLLQNEEQRGKRTVILSIVLLLSLLLVSCGDSSEETEEISFYTTDEPVYAIETEYCTLYYPEQWKELVQVCQNESEPYSLTFSANVEDKKVALFDLVFGECEGYKLGSLQTGDQEIDIYITDYIINVDCNNKLNIDN